MKSLRLVSLLTLIIAPLLPGQEPIRIREQAQFELTGDAPQETVMVAADGPDWRSLDVRMEILSADGRSLYRNQWSSGRRRPARLALLCRNSPRERRLVLLQPKSQVLSIVLDDAKVPVKFHLGGSPWIYDPNLAQ